MQGAAPEPALKRVIDHIVASRFTGRLRVTSRNADGELWFMAGVLESSRFGVSKGDEALARMMQASESTFDAEPLLPSLTGDFKQRVAVSGTFAQIPPVNLMRFCERCALTCTLELHGTDRNLRLVYQTGELLSVESDAGGNEALAGILESKEGSYAFSLPAFELPSGVARPSTPAPGLSLAERVDQRMRDEQSAPVDDSKLKAEREAAAAKSKAEQEAAAAKLKAEQEAQKLKAEQEAAAAKLKAEQEAALAKRKADEDAAKRKAEQEAAQRKAEQEAAAAKLKAEQEAQKLKAEREAAAKRKADEEAVAAKLKADEEAAKRKADEEAAAKAKAEQEAEEKRKADEEKHQAEAAEEKRKADEAELEEKRAAESRRKRELDEAAAKLTGERDDEAARDEAKPKSKRKAASRREEARADEETSADEDESRPIVPSQKSGSLWTYLIVALVVAAVVYVLATRR